MDMGLAGSRVLITAGADGIGRRIARAFIAEGATVHICDIDQAQLEALSKSDPKITSTLADVADRAQVESVFKEGIGRLGGLDVLVNNAGISGPTAPVEVIEPADWDRCIAVNLTGQFNCTRLHSGSG